MGDVTTEDKVRTGSGLRAGADENGCVCVRACTTCLSGGGQDSTWKSRSRNYMGILGFLLKRVPVVWIVGISCTCSMQ